MWSSWHYWNICVREDLNVRARRVMGVLRPLKVVIDNYPDGHVEELDAANHPKDPSMGSRKVPFSRTLFIEQDDFREEPPPKFFRLTPGREVRLRSAYIITCVSVVKDEQTGNVTEVDVPTIRIPELDCRGLHER